MNAFKSQTLILRLFQILLLLPFDFAHGQNLCQYVNPFIGTDKMGHTFPGATVPFGMVQLSPETDTLQYLHNGAYNPDVYKYCAGYQYNDKTIVGFSHTHFSGTGHSDLGDFLLMPTIGAVRFNPGLADQPGSGYRSVFDKAAEYATPGYYKVKLKDYGITAELSATERVGIHRYTFPESDSAHIIFDLTAGIYNYPGKTVYTVVRVENDTLLTGYKQTKGWARTRTVYFAMVLSKPVASYNAQYPGKTETYKGFWRKFNQTENFPDMAAPEIKLCLNFSTKKQEEIIVKFAISSVGIDGALTNLKAEAPHFNFDAYKKTAENKWERELSRINIKASDTVVRNFYTAMYHSFIAPNVFMDADGRYMGLDYRIHQAKGFTNYSTFSLWDTYRALHPLFTIIQPKRNADMVQSMLAHYQQSSFHMLPVWSHFGNDNWCMSGYHAVSVVADAIIKEQPDIDSDLALEACVKTARQSNYEGIGAYVKKGYVPAEQSGISVSNTLEYAYDDWCIAQLAKFKKKDTLYAEFMNRAANYQNVFDDKGFVHARSADGSFIKKHDLFSTSRQGLIEGNVWNYSFFVPHNPQHLVRLMGGKKQFTTRLDSLFTMYLPDVYFAETEDITREGIIGTYVHGNEPAHHVVYLYNYSDQPDKCQSTVRKIMQLQYKPQPDGLGGNDDCGQMSAWYIFSALGFYPLAPGSGSYELGSPVVEQAQIKLENGKTLSIYVKNQNSENIYVKSVKFNGKAITNFQLIHQDIMQGGEIEFEMSKIPKK